MPYGIRRDGRGYKVYKRSTGKALAGSSTSRSMARRRIRAIQASEHSNSTAKRRSAYRNKS